MNRRTFFGVISALCAALTVGRKSEIRFVEFAPPGQPPAICWAPGHVPERFAWLWSGDWGTDRIPPEQIRLGYATRQLSLTGMYLSDVPREGFEPITYWIRGASA
ncbi:MAG: hypothetical protein IT328_04525 [Caldilineaceae bacterium]|nr:hypothetical protein [Caldilineaceae bacterium]